MGIDMKKEIKVSDLWKRGPKEPKEPKAEKPPKEKKVKEPKPPKEKKEGRFSRGKKEKVAAAAAVEAKGGPPVRDIPLMHAFNLLPKEEVRAEKETKQSAIPHVIVALAGVLVFAALAAFYLSSSAAVTKKSGELDDLRGDLASLQVPEKQPENPTESANIAGERSARTAALSTALADRLAWDRVLRELALVLPADVSLATLDATAPSPGSAGAATSAAVSSFRVTGTSVSQASVARLLSRLQVIPELQNVQLEFATASEDPTQPGVNFAITASVRQGAAS
jgi:Tfp pilus assembly protein PilN